MKVAQLVSDETNLPFKKKKKNKKQLGERNNGSPERGEFQGE